MKTKGFSLMEMMVVLLIVAIIAAASAPMVSKNLSRTAGSGDSPWVFTGTSNSIAYNMRGDADSTAIIGATRVPNGVKKPKLYIESTGDEPQLGFGRNGSPEVMSFTFDTVNQRVGFTNANPIPNQGVFIGSNQDGNDSTSQVSIGTNTTGNLQSVVIGNGAQATGKNAVAIGSNDVNANTKASSTERTTAAGASVAVGSCAQATISRGTAVGYYAKALHSGSTAIGASATTTAANQIVLGTASDTVYIPGRLVVDRETIVGRTGSVFICSNTVDNKYGALEEYTDGGSLHILGKKKDSHEARIIRDGLNYKTIYLGGSTSNVFSDGFITSDRRLKNVGQPYVAGLAELNKLDFFHYTFKKDETKTPQVGVMAQDLQKVFPDAVKKGDDGFLRIRWDDMFYAVINAVKELDAKVKAIVEDVTTLKNTLKPVTDDVVELKDTVKAQQQLIDELQKQNAVLESRLTKLEKTKK